ncbi:MAG: hypothetical protein GY928_24925 [Colwellia sp.]|nr:hypothetical protein [Colwellia sp.]
MTTVTNQLLLKQWQTLHNSHEDYEKYALIIKLVAIASTFLIFTFSITTLVELLLIAALWLQEGIWKTFQSRTADAIMAIEEKLALNETEQSNDPEQLYLFYKQWTANRPNSKTLVTEYIKNSLKPTVIYPYLPLILLIIIF